MSAFNETNPAWWEWCRVYGMPSYGARQPDQGHRRRFVGGPWDGRTVAVDRAPIVVPFPMRPYWSLETEAIPASEPVGHRVAVYEDRKVQPCWSAHPVRLMVWDVMFDGENDGYALNQIMVDVFGAAAVIG